jgi:hypothetical protein
MCFYWAAAAEGAVEAGLGKEEVASDRRMQAY